MSTNVASSMRCASALFGLVFAVGLAASATPTVAAPKDGWPSRVDADYQITFNGFDIGNFEFHSDIDRGMYRLNGDAKISALLGVFQWRGITQSSGAVRGTAARPAGYSFDFATNKKRGSVKMGFNGGAVNAVRALPVMPEHPHTIPVSKSDLQGVLDPLTAVMALTRGPQTEPCTMQLPVFDGKQRFNLIFRPKSRERINASQAAGGVGVGFVCGVQYQPISGFRPGQATRDMAERTDIEIVLRPVAGTAIMMPHEIRIPTAAGTVRLTAKRISVRQQIRGRMAFAD